MMEFGLVRALVNLLTSRFLEKNIHFVEESRKFSSIFYEDTNLEYEDQLNERTIISEPNLDKGLELVSFSEGAEHIWQGRTNNFFLSVYSNSKINTKKKEERKGARREKE